MFADRFRKLIETADRAAVEDFYTDHALLDANVPSWRFQRKGLEEIAAQYTQWFRNGLPKIEDLKELPASFGAVIEMDQREPNPSGGELYSRQLHLLFAEGEKIARHVMYCTGPWDAETVEKQRTEAPMVEL